MRIRPIVEAVGPIATVVAWYLLIPKRYVTATVGGYMIQVPIAENLAWASILAAVLSIELIIIALPRYKLWRLNREILREIPSVIRVVRDGFKANLTMRDIVSLVDKANTKIMSEVMRQAYSMHSMGEDLAKALMSIGNKLRNNYVISFAVILDSVLRRGAKGVESLDMAYKSFEQFSSYNVERDNSLKPYVALVYVIMALYVLLSSIIAYMLVPQVNKISIQLGGGAAGLQLPTVDSEAFPVLLEYSIIIQSVIAGIIIGVILYNNSIAGLLHGGVLMVVLTAMNYALLITLGSLVKTP